MRREIEFDFGVDDVLDELGVHVKILHRPVGERR
jgi:hypothetical protein